MSTRRQALVLARTLALTLLALTLTPCLPADAQTHERFGMALFGTLGLGGELQVDSSYYPLFDRPTRPEFLSSALRPTLGGGVALSFVPIPYVACGALVSVRATQTANQVARRINDFDLFVAGRLPVVAHADGRTLTPYVMVPSGFSTGAGGGLLGGRMAWRGFNLGVLLGAELEVQEGLAVYAELGWQRHEVRNRSDGIDTTWVANQAVLNLGLRAAR